MKKLEIATKGRTVAVDVVAGYGRWCVHPSLGCDGGTGCGFDEHGDSAAEDDEPTYTVAETGTGRAVAHHLQRLEIAESLAKDLDRLLPRTATIDPKRQDTYATPAVRAAVTAAVDASRKLCAKEAAQVAEFEEALGRAFSARLEKLGLGLPKDS